MSRRLVVEVGTLVVAIAVTLIVRSMVAAPYAIPSASMLPTLLPGDIILVDKSRTGASASAPPARGDLMVFRAADLGPTAFVKRVIGLPGDTVAMKDGIVILNDRPVPRWRIADYVVPVSPNLPCPVLAGTRVRQETGATGQRTCRYPRFRELLPGGRTYPVLDITRGDLDDMAPRIVPAGHLFVLGDHRDRSADSRLRAGAGGLGMVPVTALIGRARMVLISLDGSARWRAPLRWRGAIRHERTGGAL